MFKVETTTKCIRTNNIFIFCLYMSFVRIALSLFDGCNVYSCLRFFLFIRCIFKSFTKITHLFRVVKRQIKHNLVYVCKCVQKSRNQEIVICLGNTFLQSLRSEGRWNSEKSFLQHWLFVVLKDLCAPLPFQDEFLSLCLCGCNISFFGLHGKYLYTFSLIIIKLSCGLICLAFVILTTCQHMSYLPFCVILQYFISTYIHFAFFFCF